MLKTGNLLTGALYVALDFFPDDAPDPVDWSQTPPRLPTQPGQLEAIEASVGRTGANTALALRVTVVQAGES